jgi:integrase
VNIDTGLRRGELLALTWEDIDFENGSINVNKNIVTAKNRKTNTYEVAVQDSTKTKSGMRKIPLTQRSLLILKELKLRQQKLSNIVFCSTNGTHIEPNNYNRAFGMVLKKAKLSNFSPHVLRHTYATRLFEINVPAKTVSELLGHASITITLNTYTHVMPETKAEAIKALDRLYANG